VRPPKLSPEQIAEILTKLAGGATPLALGEEYGVPDQTIYRHARLAKDRAWDIESAGQVNDGGDNVVPIRPAPLLTLPALAKAQEETKRRTGITAVVRQSATCTAAGARSAVAGVSAYNTKG